MVLSQAGRCTRFLRTEVFFITQAVSLGLVFGFLSFFFFFSAFSHKSSSGLYSACITNACLWRLRSCRREKLVARIPWFLGRWNHIQTNTPLAVDQHLKLLNVFGKGRSARLTRDQHNLRANVLSEFIKNHVMPKELAINWGYWLFTLIKSIFRSVIVFLDVILNQVGSQHELTTSEKQEQKG